MLLYCPEQGGWQTGEWLGDRKCWLSTAAIDECLEPTLCRPDSRSLEVWTLMNSAIEPKSDAEFARWIDAHPHGFVLHTRATPDPRYTVLHRACCYLISPAKRGLMAGAATERHSRKVCADNLDELREWLRSLGRDDGSLARTCARCDPDGRSRRQ